MIARPKVSRNEWKTAEKGAFEVGNFALLCCPVRDVRRQRAVERQRQEPRPRVFAVFLRLVLDLRRLGPQVRAGLLDLVLAREEDQHVARRLRPVELQRDVDRGADVGPRRGAEARHDLGLLAVVDVHGVRAPGHAEHGAAVEVFRELLRVERRGRDDAAQAVARCAAPPLDGALHEAEEHVRVDAPLVRLVEHDRAVFPQRPVADALADEHAVRHEREAAPRRRADVAVEAHLVAHVRPAEVAAPLLGDALRHGRRRDAPRLRDRDGREGVVASERRGVAGGRGLGREPRLVGREQVGRHLRRLAGARVADDDEEVVLHEQAHDVVARLGDGQLVGCC